ncbi:hypothetical protein [Olivibacter ginsenosidimutans]
MERLHIEISDNQYLIRLQRTDFDLNSLYALLRGLGAETPLRKRLSMHDGDDMVKSYRDSEELGDRFDYLQDK